MIRQNALKRGHERYPNETGHVKCKFKFKNVNVGALPYDYNQNAEIQRLQVVSRRQRTH